MTPPLARMCRRCSRRSLIKLLAAGSAALSARALLPALPAGAVAAPARQGQAGGKLSVSFWFGAQEELDAWRARTEYFKESHPGVEIQEVSANGWGQVQRAKLETMIAGGNAPDVIRLLNYDTVVLASRDAIIPLDDLIKNDATVNWDDFLPKARDAMKWGGKIYGLPENAESYAIYYNRDAFAAAGLPDPNDQAKAGEWTAEAFLTAAKKLTSGEGSSKKFGFLHETWTYENWIFAGNGKILSDDATEVLLDRDEATSALQWAADLANVHRVAPSPVEIGGRPPTEIFAQGIAAMYLMGRWYAAYFENTIKDSFRWDVAPMFKLVKIASKYEVDGYAISTQSKNKDLAWEYVRTITDTRGQLIWSSVGIPTRKSALEDPSFASIPWSKAYIEMLPLVEFTPYIPQSAEIERLMLSELEGMWLGRESAKDATARTAQKIRDVLAG